MRHDLKPGVNVEVQVNGRLVDRGHNLITDAGLAHMAGLLNGAVSTTFRYVALGTGTVPADAADTAMTTEKTDDGAERLLAQTLSRQTAVVANDTTLIVASFSVVGNFNLSEIGLFSALTTGVMAAHRVFSPVAVLNGQSVVVTWTFVLAEGA